MCSLQNNLPEPDMLQMNMETISKELNDLIVAGEKEFGMTQQSQQQPSVINVPLAKEPFLHINQTQLPQYMMQYYQNPEQLMAAAAVGLQNFAPNLNYIATYQQPTLGSKVATAANNPITTYVPYTYVYPASSYANGSQNLSRSSLGSAYASACAFGSPPKYEFHYLRPQAENIKSGSVQFHSNAVKDDFGSRSTMGTYRKYQKPTNKHQNLKILNEGLDYDKIVVDLSILGWPKDGKEINPVLRLFAQLRDLYNAIAEVPPSYEPPYDSEYEPTFAPLPKCNMPCTMNVQYQVKQAFRKATVFLCDMQRILNQNKMYDHNLHAECERYLNNLRQLVTQLELYKRVELEHKRGQFIKEDIKVHAERLELLLEHINRQIREVNIRITSLDWFIGIQHRGEVRKASEPIQIDRQSVKKSKIGVINEILQLCNNTTKTITSANTTTAAVATNTKSEIPKTATKIKNNEELGLNGKPQVKIDDNFNVLTPTGLMAASTTSACLQKTSSLNLKNTRHPVFYIG